MAIDWAKNPSTNTAKFFTSARYTIADEIIKRSKKPERTTPGPFAYKNDTTLDYTKGKSKAFVEVKDERITFCDERSWFSKQTPGFSHYKIEPVSESFKSF